MRVRTDRWCGVDVVVVGVADKFDEEFLIDEEKALKYYETMNA